MEIYLQMTSTRIYTMYRSVFTVQIVATATGEMRRR